MDQLIKDIDFGITRPSKVRLLVVQVKWVDSQFIEKQGLAFHGNIDNARKVLDYVLLYARQATVDIVLFPELSIPEDCLKTARQWSEQSGSIIVLGSHYFQNNGGFISRCPTIIGGKVFFSEKITPAPIETSPIYENSLRPGTRLLKFMNNVFVS